LYVFHGMDNPQVRLRSEKTRDGADNEGLHGRLSKPIISPCRGFIRSGGSDTGSETESILFQDRFRPISAIGEQPSFRPLCLRKRTPLQGALCSAFRGVGCTIPARQTVLPALHGRHPDIAPQLAANDAQGALTRGRKRGDVVMSPVGCPTRRQALVASPNLGHGSCQGAPPLTGEAP
jgi:hypothetical protein